MSLNKAQIQRLTVLIDQHAEAQREATFAARLEREDAFQLQALAVLCQARLAKYIKGLADPDPTATKKRKTP